MFKGFKEFTYKMVAGANVATIIIMLLVGFSDFFQPEKFAALANLGLLFPVFLIVNLGFLLFWLLFRSKYAIIPFLGFLICFVPVRKMCQQADSSELDTGLKLSNHEIVT